MAESLLEQYGYVRNREVIAIVAGTRTKSGSTNFLRLHVIGEHNRRACASSLRIIRRHLPEPASGCGKAEDEAPATTQVARAAPVSLAEPAEDIESVAG